MIAIVWQLLFLLLWFFRLALLGRIVFDFVRVLARGWRPTGGSVIALELLYSSTDPPVKVLRRIMPPVRLGGVRFDLSIIVLLIIVYIVMVFVERAAFA